MRATALGSIIASHLILICKRNPAETALAGFEHPRSAPQHSVEILSVGVGCDVHVARPQFGDSVRATALGSIIASHLILIHKEMQRFARFAAFECAQRGLHSQPKISQGALEVLSWARSMSLDRPWPQLCRKAGPSS